MPAGRILSAHNVERIEHGRVQIEYCRALLREMRCFAEYLAEAERHVKAILQVRRNNTADTRGNEIVLRFGAQQKCWAWKDAVVAREKCEREVNHG